MRPTGYGTHEEQTSQKQPFQFNGQFRMLQYLCSWSGWKVAQQNSVACPPEVGGGESLLT